ncbi:hypothetical protein MAR_013374 [Mya arenaria]|uniref:Chitin-binding type-2 domain-containing protein n=1 Tax=Mya arenaria TaxID=6604 RepID=A0ABY7FZM6_MYAAR|nr:hypothetical protein MAR_013374 [Mya arenaria]
MFIQCVNGDAKVMKCYSGLVFDPSINTCIPRESLVCPDIKPCAEKDSGYFPHPVNCRKFIQCQQKKETVMECHGDLVWSIAVNSCVHKTSGIKCYNINEAMNLSIHAIVGVTSPYQLVVTVFHGNIIQPTFNMNTML